MKKVLVLNGSPKKASDTMAMTRSFLEGLEQVGGFDIQIVDVIDKRVAPCRGCFACWVKGDGHCVYEDDQNTILDAYALADVIVWSFPLYCYAMPSHLKAVLDRTIPFNAPTMEVIDGRVLHPGIIDFSKKKAVAICGCGFPNWSGNFDGVRIMCKNAFRNPTMVCVPEAPLMNVPEAQVVAGSLRERFKEAGKEFARTGSLSAETIAELEHPMIPSEAYLAAVNG